MSAKIEGRRIYITGIVQGVGFRPFVYGLATRYELGGWVLNNSSGVEIEIAGPPKILDAFIIALRAELPPLAVIDSLRIEKIKSKIQNPKSKIFKIRHSQAQAGAFVPISPDICVCDDCLQELFDPADRRYRYPFINCTNCGPRFTIIRDIPYDRPLTTMADFTMCPTCQEEYKDPLNRRFHAQPNACPQCGPQVEFRWSSPPPVPPKGGGVHKSSPLQGELEGGESFVEQNSPNVENQSFQGDAAIQAARQVIAHGGIVAVKGLGGFHLACDAANDEALQTLRQRKGRVDKPFAVMALDIAAIERFAEVNPQEQHLLTSKERPVVLLKKKPNIPLSDLVAPGNQYIGVMLPYTPLHYLLFQLSINNYQLSINNYQLSINNYQLSINNYQLSINNYQLTINNQSKILVMTSGNFSEEPIVKDNAEALERLSPLADAFLLHNRDIHIHCDDSVVRVLAGRELPIRRSRGYAPFPVKLPFPVAQTLAVGGELKNAFCLTKENYAFISQHIGDMENLETLQAFEKSVAHFQAMFRVEPEIIACDMHPGYLSTKWAGEVTSGKLQVVSGKSPISNLQPFGISTLLDMPYAQDKSPISSQSKIQNPKSKIEVQHHHAHIAAVMAEHGLDGSKPVIGFSFDGTGYGPDGAIWGGELLLADYKTFTRAAHLKYIPLPGGNAAIKRPYRTALAHLWAAGATWNETLPPVVACSAVEQGIIKRQLETGLNTAPTSSMGRLFDAVASLAGVRQTVTYEGQAAIEFEALMDKSINDRYQFGIPLDASQSKNLPLEIDAGPVIRAVVADVQADVALPVISAKFHNAVAHLIWQLSMWLQEKEGLHQVALSGGVFQNATLLELTVARLKEKGFETLTHRLVPPNDGGLALGQAVVANFKR